MHSSTKNSKVITIVSNIKLGSLLVIGVIYLRTFINYQEVYTDSKTLITFIAYLLALAFVCILYYLYSSFFANKISTRCRSLSQKIESLVLLMLFMSVVLITGGSASPYKILFLFIIIPNSIQFGIKYGLITAGISTLFIITTDIIYGTTQQINIPLENDIIVSSIFLITAWFLSYYAKLEKDHAQELENEANIDSLTGLYNHRYFHDSLKVMFSFGNDVREKTALIFIDIDFFKEYNDLFGHIKGDEILRKIGSLIKGSVKEKKGIVCRYGGDEFAIILTNAKKDYVIDVAETIRETIEQTYFEGQEHLPSENVTVSIGISFYSSSMKNYPDLLKCADDALYRAKFINKNKVEVYSSVFDMIKNDIEEEHFDLITSIKTLISVINAKDRYTYGHVERVVTYIKMFSDELNLSEKDKKTLVYGAYMHDIGKVNIPEVILNKKMPLNDEEWQMIKQHPQNGVEIVDKVDSLADTSPIIKFHHEKYDGTGYPEGLKGDEIPYLARILTIADSFDAMTFARPYRPAMTFSQATKELQKCSGSQFDPHLTKVFIKVINNLKTDKNSYARQNSEKSIAKAAK